MEQKISPRDVFMHLLHVIVLYVVAGSAITLLFQYINLWFPDPLNPNYGASDAIRWALSVFIVLVPVLLWTGRFLMRDARENPGKIESRIRKWLLYLTLFSAAVLIIGDVIALLYNFLRGDLTTPFIFKVVAVLSVAAAVFWYYLYELRRKADEFSSRAKGFLWGVIVIAIVVVGYGFFTAGSPFRQRQARFDVERVNDLSNIQSEIVNYWQKKGKLPASLDDLKDTLSGWSAPADPETKNAYTYAEKGNLDFSLCADFDLPSEKNAAGQPVPMIYPQPDNWAHGAGRICFDRHIDPQLYKLPAKQSGHSVIN